MDLVIELLTATANPMPTNGVDVLGGIYTSWDLNNEAQFSFAVDTYYTVGTDLSIVIIETTPGTSARHKWQASVRLNSGTAQVFTGEYISSAVANTQTTRQLTISASGQITSVAIAAGDVVSVVLTRIAASASEDANPIKIYSIVARATVSAAITSYVGRLGVIIDDVLTMFNDKSQGFITALEIITWANLCTAEITKKRLFKTSTLIDITATDGDIDLATIFTDHDDILDLYWESTGYKLYPITTHNEFQKARAICTSGADILAYYIANNVLYLVPVPSTSVTGAIRAWRTYIPAAMTGLLGNCTPPVPSGYDSMYTSFCMMKAHLKDRGSKTAQANVQMWAGMFKQDMGRLMEQSTTSGFRLMAYR